MAKRLPNHAGIRSYTKARSTGTHIGVYDGEPAGMDTEAGRWQTVCEEHGFVCSHDTLADARSFASAPEQWCEQCAEDVRRRAIGCECMTERDTDGIERVLTHSGSCPQHPDFPESGA